jgi:PAS domain S-box-containing protein
VAWELDGQAEAVEQALGGSAPQRVGWFRFYYDDQRWEWSDQVQRMHGYEPGTVTPTTELILSHKHPEDREEVAASIDDMLRHRKPFSARHRIIDTRGKEHQLVVVGDQFCDRDGDIIGTHGFYVDVTTDTTTEDAITARVAAITQRRGAIDLTKGMLMVVYGIDEDAAFNILKSLSQLHNLKLAPLAERIAMDFVALGGEATRSRAAFDRLLLTAHERVSG